jgi:hypothetical protein
MKRMPASLFRRIRRTLRFEDRATTILTYNRGSTYKSGRAAVSRSARGICPPTEDSGSDIVVRRLC